jgi:hypothetical protein
MSKRIGHFKLRGDFDPDEITRRLRLEPSWVMRKGIDWLPGAQHAIRESIWVLNCPVDACGEFPSQIVMLIAELTSRYSELEKVAKEFKGTFNLVAYRDVDMGTFWISSEVLQKIASLNFDINIDLIDSKDAICEEPDLVDKNPDLKPKQIGT